MSLKRRNAIKKANSIVNWCDRGNFVAIAYGWYVTLIYINAVDDIESNEMLACILYLFLSFSHSLSFSLFPFLFSFSLSLLLLLLYVVYDWQRKIHIIKRNWWPEHAKTYLKMSFFYSAPASNPLKFSIKLGLLTMFQPFRLDFSFLIFRKWFLRLVLNCINIETCPIRYERHS